MAVAVLTSLMKRISSLVLQASSSSREPPSSAEKQLHDLEDTMRRIHAVLDDAEEKDVNDKSEQLRLRELKEVAYDAEDAVDEYEYEVLRAKVEARRRAMACHEHDSKHADKVTFDWNSYHPKISISVELASRVKEIRERFENITNDWDRISLREKDGKRRHVKKWKALETTSCFDKNKTFGRQEDKDKIIKWLLEGSEGSNEGRVSVLAVVGMGGLGKTTLAQMVYDDPRVSQHFDLKGWVCVSEDFNVENLWKKIGTSFNSVMNSYAGLNKTSENFKNRLKGKKFFLVLDDVWNQRFELWNSLKTLLVDAGVGKILMTTRNESVANIMQTTDPIKLDILSFDDCWSLFSKISFETRDYELDHKFLDIAKKIVKKCGGLPLAVKVLASVLSAEDDEETWIKILNSELWELDDEKDNIMPALKLSYDRMSIELRPCFMYLSLFPKDSPLKQAAIVQQWMAHGFLEAKGGKREEDIGNYYFKQLLQRSILQHHNHNRGKFVMHDLIHDLAQDIAKIDYLLISTDKLYDHTIPRTIRHLSIFVKENFEIQELEPLFETRLRLRTLMLYSVKEFPINDLMPYLMSNLMNLRALSFRVVQFRKKEITLDFVGAFKHLRYLGTNMYIVDIPESMYKLYYLQTLNLRNNILNLSRDIGDLLNLRNFSGNSRHGLPHEIRGLTDLQKLRHFVVGTETSKCKLRHLKDLVNLRGKLQVSGLETVAPCDFTPSEAYLNMKIGIMELWLWWNSDLNNDFDEKLAQQVLECLRPHPNIKTLVICHYPSAILPMWLGSFSKLERLILHCLNITTLPTLGQLPSLKYLSINEMKRVRSIGRELLCYLSLLVATGTKEVKGSCFKSLEMLSFNYNSEWEEWHEVEDFDFPRLRRLGFHECPKLHRFPHLPALDSLHISRCPKLIPPSLPFVTKLHLGMEWNPGVLSSDCLPMLQDLDISEMNDDSLVFPDSQILHSIQKLSFRYCRELRSIEGLGNLTSLRQLEIYKCRHLQICPNEHLPPKLQDVQIHQSPFAKSWYQHQIWDDGSGDHQMDPESEQDDDGYGVEAMSMNSESEQDVDDCGIEADVGGLNI